jgi:SAM-dependent methyltransferase
MSPKYIASRRYWNKVFAGLPPFDSRTPLADRPLENALRWLSEGSHCTIDFGCGRGRCLLRSLVLGAKKGVGIDISVSAISTAKRIARTNKLSRRAEFRCGGTRLLSHLASASFDSGILFNIIDNLLPEDALRVLGEFRRLVKPHGRILLKLNDFVEPSKLTSEYGATRIFDGLYKEKTGLYLWNLSDKEVRDLVARFFTIEKSQRISLGKTGQFNRLYYLRNGA